jgi:hypothetical protein
MIIGFLGYYSRWIPWYEARIKRWRAIIKQKPPVDTPHEKAAEMMTALWSEEDDALFEEMKEAILSKPVLKRPDWNREFYVKTDWSSKAKGGALCQPECTPEAEEAIKNGKPGEDLGFDKTLGGLRLRPLQFISKVNTVAEQSHHSSVGEFATGRWAFNKWSR